MAWHPQDLMAALDNARQQGIPPTDPRVQAIAHALAPLKTAPAVDMGPQSAPPGFGERLLRTGAADARAALALPNAAILQPVGGAIARLGANAANDLISTHIDPAAAGAIVERALAAPPPMDAQEAVIRGLPARAAGAVAGLLPESVRAAIDRTPQPIQDTTTILAPAATAEGAIPAGAAEQTVARAPADVTREAGYTGLNTGADLKSPGAQAITDQLLADDAGVVKGAVPNVKAIQNARKVGPGKVYDNVKAAIPEKLSQDDQLKTDLAGIDSSGGSQLPSPGDVAGLKETMLGQPDMTRDQLFANISKARERAADAYAAEGDVDKTALGDAYSQIANAYENFADRQLPNGSDLKGAIPEARPQFAKSYLAEKALQGGEHFNPMVYARAARNNPDLLTGNAGIVADVANNLPPSKPNTVANALGSGLGAVGGYVAGRALGEPLGAAGLGGVAGWHLPAVVGGVRRALATGGNPELAAGTAENPALSYYFGDRGSPFGPAVQLTPPPGTVGIRPQQGALPLGQQF